MDSIAITAALSLGQLKKSVKMKQLLLSSESPYLGLALSSFVYSNKMKHWPLPVLLYLNLDMEGSMKKYTSIMLHAYSQSTGKSIEESLSDLKIDASLITADIHQLTCDERSVIAELQKDINGISEWAKR